MRAASLPRVRCSAPQRSVPLRRRFATQIAERKPSVLIIGAGASGLTLALSLLRSGIKADIIEQMSQDREGFDNGIAEGVYLPVTAMKAFHNLGVGANVERAGSILKESRVLSDKGGPFGRVDLVALGKSYGAPAVGINYRTLLRELSAAYLNQGGKIAYSTSFTKLKQSGNQVTCTFSSSKPTAVYDLIIGADGTQSKVKEVSFDKKEFRNVKRFEKWAYYTTTIMRPMAIPSDQMSEYWGNASRLLLIPSGQDTLGVRGTFTSVYPPYAMKGGARFPEEMIDVLQTRFTAGGLSHLWKLIKSEKKNVQLVFPFEQKMQTWVNGRVALIGDAAHTLMPNFAVYSALGIEDAYLLGRNLKAMRTLFFAEVTKSITIFLGVANIDQALSEWQAKRFPRVFEAQQTAWDMNKKGQRKNVLARVWRATTMFATHSNSAMTRREKKLMGDKSLFTQ